MTTLNAPRKTGMWLRDDFPHSGWRCIEIADEGSVCAMCEVTKITYNHIMVHDSLPGVTLDCGYVCAAFMTGNAEQELLREALYKWQQGHRRQLTPIEKLRRKSWRGTHYTSGAHEWGFWPKGQMCSPFLVVRVQNREGWRYSIKRPWWGWDESEHIHSKLAFATDVEAALAGIECAELLVADPQWMEAEREANDAYHAMEQARRDAETLRYAIEEMNRTGNADLATALKQDSIEIFHAFNEMRRRRKEAEDAAKQTAA
ncbi:hypothetical protein G6321_00048580 [Bradyrhizobium barranii subsp. barranii]|uniref:Uncharacterized protein n=1 Tax=Bradyrhizobium barranii subsp. barranii TaxID=2823807 RepID=A0A7Z0Q9Z7_9BRAD|nr:hypothetical protein [Bradyrhizobium barranii]UGX93377.1 hypothetical protein G6321_00048580 [Bradyrhizobium barranii subsp. barranii]